MAALITKILKDENPKIRKFSQHYITVMAIEGPCEENFYQKAFLNCFHLCQVDPQVNQHLLVCLGKLFNTYTKTAEQIDSRSRVTQSDLLDVLLEHKPTAGKTEILMVALDTVKYLSLRESDKLNDDKYKAKIFSTALNLLQDSETKTRVKVKVIEFLAALVYKGHLYALDAESK